MSRNSTWGVLVLLLILGAGPGARAAAQNPPVPKPFPQPGQPSQTVTPPATQAPGKPAAPPAQDTAPTEAALGVPIYPKAEFLTSYDAGQGQRYYLFGSNATFGEVVAYYKGVLNNKGELVFEEPPVHMFETGKFREETMAFPPSVTIKDYTWGGMAGYLNPKPGTEPQRYKTVIQIVPPPSGGRP